MSKEMPFRMDRKRSGGGCASKARRRRCCRKGCPTRPAHQHILIIAAIQRIIPVAAVERVVSAQSEQGIIPAMAARLICSCRPDERIVRRVTRISRTSTPNHNPLQPEEAMPRPSN
jgi:hypothetical protein